MKRVLFLNSSIIQDVFKECSYSVDAEIYMNMQLVIDYQLSKATIIKIFENELKHE